MNELINCGNVIYENFRENLGLIDCDYSKFSIIRTGRSRLIEFEKKIVLLFNRDFFQISRPGLLIEPKNWPWQSCNKTVQSIFSEMDLVV